MISQKRFDTLLSTLYDGSSTIVAGVSGGPDSLCMLHLLASSALAPKVVVAHVNFSLRGEESNGDMLFVERIAGQLGYPFECRVADTRAYAQEHSISVEIAAREIRYKWFGEIMRAYKPAILAVAHNANDNAETLLLNLLRGTGLKGACGISAVAPLPYREEENLKVIRPLLTFERGEIEEYLKRNSLAFRTDSTNALCDVARNRIRNIIIPQMLQINPSAIRTLNADIANFADAYKLLRQGLESSGRQFVKFRRGDLFPMEGQGTPGALFLYALKKRYLLLQLNGEALAQTGSTSLLMELLEGYGFSASQILETTAALSKRSGDAKFWRSQESVMTLEEGDLFIYERRIEEEGSADASISLRRMEEVAAAGASSYAAGGGAADGAGAASGGAVAGGAAAGIISAPDGLFFSYMIYDWEGEGSPVERVKRSSDGNTLTLDASAVSFPLRLRRAKNGDFFAPMGMKRGNKGINDYLGERKVGRLLRSHALVLEDASGRIVALPGFQVAECAKVVEESRPLMTFALQFNDF